MADDTSVTGYYGEAYFAEQKVGGLMDARACLWMFAPWVRDDDIIIDFGCGGGDFLDVLPGRRKYGVEINPVARVHADRPGRTIVADLGELPPACADVVVSKHALEHTEHPLAILRLIRACLKPGGFLVMTVPCERYDTRWLPDNWDRHLYTWAPVNLGNLVRAAGFDVLSCRRMAFRFPPKAGIVYRVIGPMLFHVVSRLWGLARPKLTQVRIVARSI